jgi:RND family efflux transporter MFP subunit
MIRYVFIYLLTAAFAASPVAAAELPTAEAKIAVVDEEQVLDGVVEAVNRSTVSAQTSGRIIELPFDVDDYVEQGQVIVRFRDTEQKAQLEQAQASLAEAQAQLAQAKAAYERIASLLDKKLVSKSQMDQARAAYESAKAREEAARAALDQAREQFDHTVVHAPYSGIVVARQVEIGETATVGQPLMTGLSLEHLRVAVEVPQEYIDTLRANRAARVLLPDGESLDAAAIRVFPYASEKSHTFRVRVTLPKGQHGIYPGMLVKVAFVSGRRESLMVPREAVVRRSEVTAVYVLDKQGELHFRQIRAGTVRADGRVPVLAGLDPGETIITDPVRAAVALKEGEEKTQ